MDKNNIDKNLYNEKSLYLLNIRELRDMGRKFGVPSPTTMKKQDLVDYILKIVYGEINPPIRSSCGRPNSREFDMNRYVDKIKKNTDLVEQLKEFRLDDENDYEILKFKAATPKEKNNVGEIEQRVVFRDDRMCSLRIRQFVESAKDIILEKNVADDLNLQNFDVVEIISTDGGIKIVSINGKKISNNIKSFEIADENVMAGSRKVFHIRTKEKIIDEINKVKENCVNQNLRMIYFGFDVFEESNIDCFKPLCSQTYQDFKEFMIFVEHCKKLVYDNQDFIVVIEEMKIVENIINLLEKEVSDRVKKHLNDDINNMLKLGNVLLTFHKIEEKILF